MIQWRIEIDKVVKVIYIGCLFRVSEKHAPLFSSLPAVKKHVRRYVQQHTVPLDIPGLPPMKYDGITEIWFDSKEDIGAVFNDPEYFAKIRPDEELFLDLNGCDFVVSEENIVISL